jgi:hypothetical protein
MKLGIATFGPITLTAATPMTVCQLLAATNHGIRLAEIHVAFAGTNNTHVPIKVDLMLQSDAGTGGDAVTIEHADQQQSGETFDTSALKQIDSSDPTDTSAYRKWLVHPQTGLVYQFSDIATVDIGAGDYVGLKCTATSDDIDVTGYMCFIE